MAETYDLDAAREAVTRTTAALDELEAPALEWADGKLPTVRRFEQALNRHLTDKDREFPEGWYRAAASQLLAGALFGSPSTVTRFLRDAGGTVSVAARQLAESCREEPWRFTTFDLRDSHPGDFHTCRDHDTGEPFLLHSPSVSTLSRQGCRVFLSLLLDAGPCRLCFGGVHYFRSFQPYDFAAFAEAIEPQLFASRGLSATIGRHAELFLLLSLYSEIPPQELRGTPMVLCAEWHQAQKLPAAAHPERLESRTSGHVTQLALRPTEPGATEPASFAEHALLFHDSRKRLVMAHAMGTVRYAELVEAAGPAWGFAPLPRWKAGMTMVIAMRRLLKKDSPGHDYIERFEDKAEERDDPKLEGMNALLAEMAMRHNAGAPYVLDELARRYGVDPEVARQLEQSLRGAVERSRGRSPGRSPDSAPPAFEGFTPPPPDTLRLLNCTLGRSRLFALDASAAVAQELRSVAVEATRAGARGGRRGEIRRLAAEGRLGPDDLPRFIEEEFLRAFGLPDVTVLAYTLYLLLSFGAEPRPVPEYAGEIFSALQGALSRARDVSVPELLAATLARYLSGVLEPLGLVTTTKRDEATLVETTALFRRWIKLSAYWE